MEEEQICQIVIPGDNGELPQRRDYSCNLIGRYRARVVGIVFADRTNSKDNRLIAITSNCFKTSYGSYPNTIAFCNRHEANVSNPQGDYPFIIDAYGQSIDITIKSSILYTGAANDEFDFVILSLAVKKMA